MSAAVAALGPPLGRLLFPAHDPYTFLSGSAGGVHLEPTEHARYLLALSGPLLLALATALAPRWQPRLPAAVSRFAVPAAQALLGALIIACVIAQNRLTFGAQYAGPGQSASLTVHYFKPATLVVAALLAGATLVVVRSAPLHRRAAALLRETQPRHVWVAAVAAAITVLWLLHAVQTDQSIAAAEEDVRYHLEFTLDETFAVLNGRTPLVDFTAQYGSLWPFVAALPLLVLGKTVLVFTITMCTISAFALLAIFDVLRRVTRSSVAALALYAPLLATSLFTIGGDAVNRSTVGTYFANFPLRYAGPFVLAWLTARHIGRGDRTRSLWLLGVVAGLALLNNADFGVAALGATVAALLWTVADVRRATLLRLAGWIAAGLATALVLVSLLTLARAGSLPQLGRLLDYARVYTLGGFALMPIPGVLGMHLVIYLTYVAAIAVATVRALRRASNRVLTGMLAWSGVFGLGAASYYVGRSHPVALKSMFAAWALALALLTIVVVRQLAAQPSRRPTVAAVAVLFGFGVAVCSLTQAPMPWTQLQRLDAPFVAGGGSPPDPLLPPRDARTRAFVASLARGPSQFVVKRGAPVAILLTTGHRIADAYGVVNVSPYTGIESLQTEQRVDAVVAALRRAGGNTIVLPNPLDPSILELLARRGFAFATASGLRAYRPGHPTGAVMLPWPGAAMMKVMKMVDTHDLEPRALR